MLRKSPPAISGFSSTLQFSVGRSLRRQLTWRLLAVFAIVALVGSTATVLTYQHLMMRAQRAAADDAQRFVTTNLAQLRGEWLRNATEVRAQIDFMRTFSDPELDGWARLRAYFASLEGKIGKFPSGAVLFKDGTLGLSFGPESPALLKALQNNAAVPAWTYSADLRSVYMLVATPLWLGSSGNGQMVLMQPVDTVALDNLTPVDVHLFLVAYGKVLASNRGSQDVGMVMDVQFQGQLDTQGEVVEQRVMAAFGDAPSAPRLVMHQVVREPVSLRLILLTTLAMLAALTVVLWLVIGRWARRATERIAELSRATALFAGEHTMGTALQDALDHAQEHRDEIGMVAQSCRDLMESVLLHDQEHFAYLQTLDILEEGVVEVEEDGSYRHSSPGWARLAGASRRHASVLFDSFHADDRESFRLQFAKLFSGEKTSLNGRVRLHREDDKDVWIEYRFVVSELGSLTVRSVRGVLRDITQSYMLEKHVTHMALHDALTGLPNRVLLEDRCKIALRTAGRNGQQVALGFMDLDHFKHVNDQFGHKVGDELLLLLSNALRNCLRSGDTLARWGGDEFVVLLTDLTSTDGAREAIAKLVSTCHQPITIEGNVFNATFSMGVAMYPNDAETVDGLLSQADRAMFSAKEQGRNNIRFFADISNHDDSRKAVYIQHRLATAIKEKKIQTWFQPIVDARTHRVVSCEALARWHDESYGWVSPATFVPMAESLGLIRELGQQVWEQAVNALHAWREAGMDMRISVNVSRRQLFTPTFTADLLTDLERLAIPVSVVDLEITESVAMEDADQTAKRLTELTQAGFGIAIDDFGTGYSSFSQLHDMPATKIKIDISFVRRVQTEQGAQLIQAIVKIASAFKLKTVAEGVETAEVADALLAYDVDQLQGYQFGKPMPAAEFRKYLDDNFLPGVRLG